MSDEEGNDCRFSVPRSSFKVQLFARCGLVWDKARLGAPGLARVRCLNFLSILRAGIIFLYPASPSPV